MNKFIQRVDKVAPVEYRLILYLLPTMVCILVAGFMIMLDEQGNLAGWITILGFVYAIGFLGNRLLLGYGLTSQFLGFFRGAIYLVEPKKSNVYQRFALLILIFTFLIGAAYIYLVFNR